MRFAPLVPKPKPTSTGTRRKVQEERKLWETPCSSSPHGYAPLQEHDFAQWLTVAPNPDPLANHHEARTERGGAARHVHPEARTLDNGEVTDPPEREDDDGSDQITGMSDAAGVPPRDNRRGPSGGVGKLEIGAADDPLEREADEIADRVMRMPAPSVGHASFTEGARLFAHRQYASCEVELRRAAASIEVDELQREPAAGQGGGLASEDFAARVQSRLRIGGSPLPLHLRSFLEPRLETGLGAVRLHTDSAAGMLARQINARAFTLGQDIFFAPGELRPQTQAGMRLIAHEIGHTLQEHRPLGLIHRSQPKHSGSEDVDIELAARATEISVEFDGVTVSSSLGQPLGVREDETAAFVPFVTAALFGDALSVAEKTFITSGYRGMPSSSLIPLEQHRTLRIEYTLITDILAQLYYSGSAEKDESFAEFTAALLSRSRIPESGRARALRKINAIFMYGTTQAFAAAKQTNISWPLDWPALYLILADKRHEITDAFAKAISEDEAKAAIKGLGQTLRPFNLATAQMALFEGRTCTYYINGSRTA